VVVKHIDYDKCNDCGICYDICPLDVYRRVGRTHYIAYQRDCMTCFLCELECPTNAIYVGPERGRQPVLPY